MYVAQLKKNLKNKNLLANMIVAEVAVLFL